MTFKNAVTHIINQHKSSTEAETRRQIQLAQQEDRSPFAYFAELSIRLQSSILAIAGGAPVKFNKNNQIYLCHTLQIANGDRFEVKAPAPKDGVDLFKHFSNVLPNSEFESLQALMAEQEIKGLVIYWNHDGAGRETWNDIYAII